MWEVPPLGKARSGTWLSVQGQKGWWHHAHMTVVHVAAALNLAFGPFISVTPCRTRLEDWQNANPHVATDG